MSEIDIDQFDEKNPYKSNAPGTYFQLRPYLLSCKSLDVIKGRALALNSRQGSLTVKDERDGKCLKFETTVIQFSRFHWFQIDSNWFHLWKFDPICLKFAKLMDFFFQVKLSWKGTFDGNEVCGQLDIEEIGVFRFR